MGCRYELFPCAIQFRHGKNGPGRYPGAVGLKGCGVSGWNRRHRCADRLLQQTQNVLGAGVGLGQSEGAGLRQNLEPGEVG